MRILLVIVLTVFLFGCATTAKKPIFKEKVYTKNVPVITIVSADEKKTKISHELHNIQDEQLAEYKEQKGVIFAKTSFLGVLKKTYVQLLFEDQKKPENKFQLLIGDIDDDKNLPWNVKTVEPGYFFIELPAGNYKISSVSIPVGSTMAEEDINISIEVTPGSITYAGTLTINGTKERIRLGGVPVIKPGFEYKVFVADERQEGIETFRKRYPDFSGEIVVKLMKIAE
jgi:hypothetical protein